MVAPKVLGRGKAFFELRPHSDPNTPYLVHFCFSWTNKWGENLYPRASNTFKVYPGCTYTPHWGKGTWSAPKEALPWLVDKASKMGLPILDRCGEAPTKHVATIPRSRGEQYARYYAYQKECTFKSLREGAQLACFDTGLGKSAYAILVGRLMESGMTYGPHRLHLEHALRALVVTPKQVIPEWYAQLEEWWGEDWETYWHVINYESLHRLERSLFDLIVLDEAHYIKKAQTKRAKIAHDMGAKNPQAIKLALTATPVADKLADLHAILDFLRPQAWGWHGKFCDRYCGQIPNKYRPRGYDYKGLNEAHLPELRERLTTVMTRVTHEDVGDILPPLSMYAVRAEHEKKKRHEDALKRLITPDGDMRKHEASYLKWLVAASSGKIKVVDKLIADSMGCGIDHLAVVCRLRKTAHGLRQKCSTSEEVHTDVITGEIVNAAERIARIKKAREQPKSILYLTFGSIGVGINALKDYNQVIFAELDYYPVNVLQTAGRFRRLGTKARTVIRLVVLNGSIEEVIAYTVVQKLGEMDRILKSGDTGKKLEGVLGFKNEDWRAQLVQSALSIVEEEEEE